MSYHHDMKWEGSVCGLQAPDIPSTIQVKIIACVIIVAITEMKKEIACFQMLNNSVGQNTNKNDNTPKASFH